MGRAPRILVPLRECERAHSCWDACTTGSCLLRRSLQRGVSANICHTLSGAVEWPAISLAGDLVAILRFLDIPFQPSGGIR